MKEAEESYSGGLGRKRISVMAKKKERKFSYRPLWHLLIDKGLKKKDLEKMSGVSAATIAKLGRNENVTTEVLLKICNAMDCEINQIVELVND